MPSNNMTSANMLAYLRGDCKAKIVADAGHDGLGAVLLQPQDNTNGKGNILLSRLNQANPKDSSSEKKDIVRYMTQESTLVTDFGSVRFSSLSSPARNLQAN